jgi:site-specific recombinase XerD
MKHLERFKKMVKWSRQLNWIAVDPFSDYKLALKRYRRVKLDIHELERIESSHYENPILSYVKDLFLFSCYTGLAYADVMALKQVHFDYDREGKAILKIYREKSNELSSVPVLNIALQLMNKYKEHPQAKLNGTIFPQISNQDLNRNLKIMAEVCGINKYMSFHLARHTFATVVTLKNGVPIETVSKMLGHTKISTTEIYAEVDDEKIMADMSEVENRINKGKETRKLMITINK